MWRDVLRSLLRRPVTELYPAEQRPAPTALRGRLHYDPAKCTGCSLCVKDCPADAIQIVTIDKSNKHYAMIYHVDRCTFCGQCVDNCRFDCISMDSQSWELADTDREGFQVAYGREDELAMARLLAGKPEDTK